MWSSAAFITSTHDTCLERIARDSAIASNVTMSEPDILFCGRHRGKAALEVGDQVADVLKPDVQTHAGATRRPFGRAAIFLDVVGDGEALEATPRRAHPEQ